MMYYRLLRDNKESGPFSEEEMIARGFKPYDLLWTEGKSAGWRYASEIAEFKSYAPVVEEQPYDRFYKKPAPQTSISTESAKTYTSFTERPVESNQLFHQQTFPDARPQRSYDIQSLPAKHIHVILPSGNTFNLTAVAAKNDTGQQPVSPAAAVPETNIAAANYQSAVPAETAQISFAEAVYKLQEPLTKEEASVYNFVPAAKLHDGHTAAPVRPALASLFGAGFSWTLIMGAIVGVATLVGLGVMIGLSMNRDKNEAAFNEMLRNNSKQQATPVTKSTPVVADRPGAATDIPVAVPQQPVRTTGVKKELIETAVVKNSIVPAPVEKGDKDFSAEVKPLVEKNILTKKEDARQLQSTPSVANIEKMLTLNANDFRKSAFGGISNLKYTLYNGSATPLASVEVEIDYIQANEKIYKTERLLFKDVSAGSQLTINAPSSNRGVKIISRVVKVNPASASTAKS